MQEKSIVLVTGASGFIGGHCVLALLNKGYAVRAVVRSESRIEKCQALINTHYPDNADVEYAIASSPNSVSISPDGKFLAIDNKEKGRELVIVELEDGLPQDSRYFTLKNDSSEVGIVRAISWHPNGRYLAPNLNDTRVAFYEFKADGSIEPFGERFLV